MIVKHIENKVGDSSLVFLAQSARGTLLYDYNKEVFLVVEGFSMVTPHKCAYDKSTVQRFYSLVKAYKIMYPEGDL